MGKSPRPWFCYMVRCRDGSLYVGIATDPEERTREHNRGAGAAFTAKRRPVELVWFEEFSNQQEAHKREVELKGWTRGRKLKLIEWFRKEKRGKAR